MVCIEEANKNGYLLGRYHSRLCERHALAYTSKMTANINEDQEHMIIYRRLIRYQYYLYCNTVCLSAYGTEPTLREVFLRTWSLTHSKYVFFSLGAITP